jgi:hypothetical protein
MAKKLLLLVVALTLVAAQVTVNATPQAAPGGAGKPQTATIQGIVTRRGTNVPIPDVRVTVTQGGLGTAAGVLVGPSGETISVAPPRGAAGVPEDAGARGGASSPFWTVVTDGAGRFTISEVPIGAIRVRAQLEGYFGPLIGADYASFAATDVTVSPDRPTNVTIALIPGATISGRVYDPSGKPLTNASVELLRRGYENGVVRFLTSEFKPTDDRGEYRLFQLPPGEYYLSAAPRSTPAALSANARFVTSEIPVQTFYPNATEPTSVTPITLHDGEELTGTDIRLRTALTGNISGKVVSEAAVSPDGHGVYSTATPGLSVVRRDGVGLSLDSRAVEAQPDGSFDIRNVLPGSYEIFARVPTASYTGWGPAAVSPERAGGPFAIGRTSVDVRAGVNTEGIVVLIRYGSDLPGRLIVDGKPAAANVRISAVAERAGVNDGVIARIYDQIANYPPAIGQDGGFKIPLLPQGKYRLQVSIGGLTPATVTGRGQVAPAGPPPPSLPATAYVADVLQGGFSVYDNGLTIGNTQNNPLDVQVNTNGGSIEGTVRASDQKPVRATVVLVPLATRRQNPALYKSVRSDAQGHFQLTALAPGSYTMLAWEAVPNGAWQNAEFLANYAQRGVSVIVNPGTRSTADLTAISDR